MKTRLFKLLPLVPAGSPDWDIAAYQGEVIVRALSPADARIVASHAEIDFLDVSAKPAHGVSTRMASAFRNLLLYSVVKLTDDRFQSDGPREVVDGQISNPLASAIKNKPNENSS